MGVNERLQKYYEIQKKLCRPVLRGFSFSFQMTEGMLY